MDQKNFDLEKSFPVEHSHRNNDAQNAIAKLIIGDGDFKRNSSYIGITAVFGGMLGLHDFICGNTRNGVLKLIFSCLGFASIFSFAWTISDLYKLGNGTYKAANGTPLEAIPWCKKAAVIITILVIVILVLGCLGYITLRTRFR